MPSLRAETAAGPPVPTLVDFSTEAQLLVADKLGGGAPKLPEQVAAYALAMRGVVADADKIKAGPAGAAFKFSTPRCVLAASSSLALPQEGAARPW